MAGNLRILFVEDSEDDRILLTHQIEKGGLKTISKRVDNAADLENELKTGRWDLILTDYAMPLLNGLEALKIIKHNGHNIPTILISGLVGEEIAVKAMKAGADDFITKNKLDRLVPAIWRELEAAAVRREKYEAEKKLKDSEEKYRTVVENAAEGIIVIQDGFFRYANREICELLGLDEATLRKRKVLDFIHPEDRERAQQIKNLPGKKPYDQFILRIIDKNNNIKWSANKRVAINWDNRPATLVFINDITEKLKAEEQLESQRNLFEQIIDHIPVMINLYDTDINVNFLNKEFERALGWSLEEIKQKGIMNLVCPDPEYRQMATEYINQARTGEWKDFELQTNYGHKLYSSWMNTLLPNGMMLGIGIDLTARKKMEKELQASEERFKLFMKNFPGAAYIKDWAGRFIYINDYAEGIVGSPNGQIIGKTSHDIWPRDLAEKIDQDDKTVLESNKVLQTIDKINHSGSDHYYLELKFPLNLADERPHIGCVALDITQAKEYEEQLKILAEELEERRQDLERKNTALSEVLAQIERDKDKIKERFLANIELAILPSVIRLKERVRPELRRSIEVMERELENITSPFLDNLKGKYRKLTNREVEVCRLIKNGLTSKEIADVMAISPQTVQKYRENVRKKFSFVNKGINLNTFLSSLADDSFKS